MKLSASDITVRKGGRANKGAPPIVDGANLYVETGELVGLIGPNGAGKSTLLRAIAGLGAYEGGALIDGHSADRMNPAERARAMAYLPQEGVVEWGITAREVVALGRHPFQRFLAGANSADLQAVEEVLAEVEAGKFADRAANVLSGGEKARVLLARALAVGAPFLLADEPIAVLDPYHQLLVMEVLQNRARRGSGVLLVLHDLNLAMRFCDRVIVMNEGVIVAEGPPDLVLDADLIDQIYRITPVRGVHDGRKWLFPWNRRGQV